MAVFRAVFTSMFQLQVWSCPLTSVLLLQQTRHQPAQLMPLQPPTASPMSTRWFSGLQTQLWPAHQLLLGTGRSTVRYVHTSFCCAALPSLVSPPSAVSPMEPLIQTSMSVTQVDGHRSYVDVAALMQSCLQHFAASGLKSSAQSFVQLTVLCSHLLQYKVCMKICTLVFTVSVCLSAAPRHH